MPSLASTGACACVCAEKQTHIHFKKERKGSCYKRNVMSTKISNVIHVWMPYKVLQSTLSHCRLEKNLNSTQMSSKYTRQFSKHYMPFPQENCTFEKAQICNTYPINSAEVNSLSKIKTLVETTVIGSWKCDHKLPSTLICSINL